jgi:hypothetical protein
MFRFVLIALMLLQPLQWTLAAVHIASDAAHGASHRHTDPAASTLASAGACNVLGHMSDAHACHDNHTHTTTVLGPGADPHVSAHGSTGCQRIHAEAPRFDSVWLTPIERPKWMATR